jgi:hypothetical protein
VTGVSVSLGQLERERQAEDGGQTTLCCHIHAGLLQPLARGRTARVRFKGTPPGMHRRIASVLGTPRLIVCALRKHGVSPAASLFADTLS